jgi:hypothetical protein
MIGFPPGEDYGTSSATAQLARGPAASGRSPPIGFGAQKALEWRPLRTRWSAAAGHTAHAVLSVQSQVDFLDQPAVPLVIRL